MIKYKEFTSTDKFKNYINDKLTIKEELELEREYTDISEKPLCSKCMEALTLGEAIDPSPKCMTCRYEN